MTKSVERQNNGATCQSNKSLPVAYIKYNWDFDAPRVQRAHAELLNGGQVDLFVLVKVYCNDKQLCYFAGRPKTHFICEIPQATKENPNL